MGSMEYGQQLKREPVTHWHLRRFPSIWKYCERRDWEFYGYTPYRKISGFLTSRYFADAINHKYLEHRIKDQINPQQGTPMAIPGHEGTELCELENEIYVELCKDQHQIDLFVSSKAGEISRRLGTLESCIFSGGQTMTSSHLLIGCCRTPSFQNTSVG